MARAKQRQQARQPEQAQQSEQLEQTPPLWIQSVADAALLSYTVPWPLSEIVGVRCRALPRGQLQWAGRTGILFKRCRAVLGHFRGKSRAVRADRLRLAHWKHLSKG